MKYNYSKPLFFLALLAAFAGCRKDDPVRPPEVTPVTPQSVTTIEGLYLLNEGNMGTNQASLDYYDFATGRYSKNIYVSANPGAVKELGDVGNDIGIYGSKLYAIINVSNKLEIMDANTAKRIKTITIKNCRYVIFNKGKAYVSAYDGEVVLGPGSPNGFIAEIDTSTLEITRTVAVGRQPEQMAIVGNKLYIANSGGYSPPQYERTISVIDLETFQKIKDIDVAINLHLINADSDGDLYVSSRGDYFKISANYFVIDTKADIVKRTFNIAVNGCAFVGDTAFVYGSEWSYITNSWNITYNMIDTKKDSLLQKNFITDGTESSIQKPYGIAVDPYSRYIYLTDAKDYVSSGFLHCYNKEGKRQFSVLAGNIPAHIAFKYKTIIK